MPEQRKGNPEYHWAYACIHLAHEDIKTKCDYVRSVHTYFGSTLNRACDLSATRRDLAAIPCVTKEIVFQIHDEMMLCAEHVHHYISRTQKYIEALQQVRTHRHAAFDLTINGAASSSTNQREPVPPNLATTEQSPVPPQDDASEFPHG